MPNQWARPSLGIISDCIASVWFSSQSNAYPCRSSRNMSKCFVHALLFFVSISFAATSETDVRAQAVQGKATDQTLDQLWSDLIEAEPTCTQAVLKLSKQPGIATKFLAAKLPPLKLSGQHPLDAIWRLGSDNEQEWREAYQKLDYFDPRLAMGLEEILALEAAKEYPARNRLVDILSGRSVDAPYSATSQRYQSIVLHQFKDDGQDYFNFVGSGAADGEGGCSLVGRAESGGLERGI